MPFRNISGNPEHEYFSDGITEDIIGQLSKVSDLKVIGRTSVMRYKNTEKDVSEIGAALKVRYILEGSVRHAGNRVRIRSALVEVESQRQIWADVFDRKVEDIFAVQTEVSEQIAGSLSTALPGSRQRRAEKGPANADAYQLYLKGRYFSHKINPDGIAKSIEYMQRALEADPMYAPAWAGMASCYANCGYFKFLPPKEAFSKARAAAQRAIDIDEMLAEGHTSMALVYLFHDWDWQAADRSFRRAIELDPNSVDAHVYYSWALQLIRRPRECLTEARRAVDIDPLSPLAIATLANALLQVGRYDDAIVQLEHTLEIDPNYAPAHGLMCVAYVSKGMMDEALAESHKIGWMKSVVALVSALSGRHDDARALLAEITSQPYVWPSEVAQLYLYLGERDEHSAGSTGHSRNAIAGWPSAWRCRALRCATIRWSSRSCTAWGWSSDRVLQRARRASPGCAPAFHELWLRRAG